MSRPRRIPDRGDVPRDVIAARLGLSIADFEVRLAVLRQRGFPEPDQTTGHYCIEAVDRWRLLRHRVLFPELMAAPGAAHAATVLDERMARNYG